MATLPNNGGEYIEHWPGSPEERIEVDGSTATRIFDVPWENRVQAAQAILGKSYPRTWASTSHFVERIPPMAHPSWLTESNSRPFLYATKITRIQGIGVAGNPGDAQFEIVQGQKICKYNQARLTVQFETPTYEIYSDAEMINNLQHKDGNNAPDESYLSRYVTKKVFPTAQYLTINSGMFYYVIPDGSAVPSTANPVLQGLGKMLVSFNVSLTWHQVPSRPSRVLDSPGLPCSLFNDMLEVGTGHIEKSLGKVNSDTFLNCWKGTLLLTACEIKPLRSPFGERIYDITYMFKFYQPNGNKGHNHFFRAQPPPPAWYEVSSDGATNLVAMTDGKSVYDFYDFKKLFRLQTFP